MKTPPDSVDLESAAELVKAQRAFFNSNATKPIEFRVAQLRRFRDMLKQHEPALCAAIRADYGKSDFDSFLTEFLITYDDLEGAIRGVGKWSRRKRVRTNLLN